MILLLTEKHDLSADLVVLALRRSGAAFLRINTDQLLIDYSISSSVPGGFSRIACRNGVFDLSDITVWNRRPTIPAAPPGVSDENADFVGREGWAALQGMLMQPSTKWVNHPSANARANVKLTQLSLAQKCGLTIPRSIVTNDVSDATRFRDSCAAGCIAKPLSHGHLMGEQGELAIYTSRIDRGVPLDAVAVCPVLLQEEVLRGYDVRLTAVGRELMAASVSWDHASSVDWRSELADDTIRYEPVEVPADIASRVLSLHQQMDLVFGAYDFVVSPDGQWTFLEVNPMGQWGWLNKVHSPHIAEVLAALLLEIDGGYQLWR